jgi:hypothetical protein
VLRCHGILNAKLFVIVPQDKQDPADAAAVAEQMRERGPLVVNVPLATDQ